MKFEPLTDGDLSRLQASWITPELAEQANIGRVDSLTGEQLVGRNGNADYSGIVFPCFQDGKPIL